MNLFKKTILSAALTFAFSLSLFGSDSVSFHNQYIAPHSPQNFSLEVPEGARRLVAKITWSSAAAIHDLYLMLKHDEVPTSYDNDCRILLGYSGKCVINYPEAGVWEVVVESYRSRNYGLEFYYY